MMKLSFNNRNSIWSPYHTDKNSIDRIYKCFDKIHSIMKHFQLHNNSSFFLCWEHATQCARVQCSEHSVQPWPKRYVLSPPCLWPLPFYTQSPATVAGPFPSPFSLQALLSFAIHFLSASICFVKKDKQLTDIYLKRVRTNFFFFHQEMLSFWYFTFIPFVSLFPSIHSILPDRVNST